jgi:endonuclease/exonuclease/phosphatase family metal-dependent hydrolase
MAAVTSGTSPLVVATYNVHRCIGRDGCMVPERVAAVIRELDAQLVGLQEVDSCANAGLSGGQMERLAQATGLTAIAGPTLRRADGHYGNVLLSARQVLEVTRWDLSVAGREPRGAIDATVDTGRGELRVLVTHLGLQAAERRVQLRRISQMLGSADERPVLLMGDINEWLPLSPRLRALRARVGRSPWKATFPARWPLLGLDRIWVRPPRAVLALSVHRSALARAASDHLPLKASIALDRLSAAPEGQRLRRARA